MITCATEDKLGREGDQNDKADETPPHVVDENQ